MDVALRSSMERTRRQRWDKRGVRIRAATKRNRICRCQHPLPPCGLCDFFKSGGALPDSPASLNVPVFYCLPVPDSGWFTASTVMLVPSPELEGQNIVPPRVPRMCEWMVSTAAPVRGPNPCA